MFGVAKLRNFYVAASFAIATGLATQVWAGGQNCPSGFAKIANKDHGKVAQVPIEHGTAERTAELSAEAKKANAIPRAMPTDEAGARRYLADRYGVAPDSIRFTADKHYPVIVRNKVAAPFAPTPPPNAVPVVNPKTYDTIVIGGGPAGLTSSLYLTDKGKSVMILEREAKLGGLGTGSELSGIRAGGGAAYSAGPDGLKQYKIFQHIGLGNYKKNLSIHEPIDSFFWNGKMYLGVWENEETLSALPKSFQVFKHVLKSVDKADGFATDSALGAQIDKLNMADFVRDMPRRLSEMTDAKSKKLYAEYLADAKVNRKDPMADVMGLLDNYGRSALGGEAHDISARQFGDFYVAELETRYTGSLGTGEITESIMNKLANRVNRKARDLSVETNSPVMSVENVNGGVRVRYLKDGTVYEVHAKKAVLAAPMNLAPKLIPDYAAKAPERVSALEKRPLTDYIVHTVHVKGHPFRETYDLWIRSKDYNRDMPTDIIAGRWMDPKIKGYEGIRNFEGAPVDDYGVLTIYHPQGMRTDGQWMNDTQMMQKAEGAVDQMQEWLTPYLKEKFGSNIQVELIETFRWPGSIHQVTPGSLESSKILAEPFGNILFANNTLGAPELEEALERGFDVAQDINKSLDVPIPTAIPAVRVPSSRVARPTSPVRAPRPAERPLAQP